MRAVVVGAGLIGLALADELTRRGVQVEIFEKASVVGSEASSAAAGILSPHGEVKGPGPFLDFLTAGFQLIPEMVSRLQSETHVDLFYRVNGMLSLAFSDQQERELSADLVWQERAGLKPQRVTAAEIKKWEPAVDGQVRWGIWWPHTSQIDNARLVEAFCRAVGKQRGIIRTNQAVSRFCVKGDRVVGIETPSGMTEADVVINCAGSWAGFDAGVPFSVPTVPVKGQMLEFQTSIPLCERILKSGDSYLVQRSSSRLIAGTTVEKGVSDKSVTEDGKRSILEGVLSISSQVSALPLTSAWAGLRPGTPDGLPILGPTPVRGLWVASGHYRNGVLLAPLTGRVIADQILNERTAVDLSPFSISRFQGSVPGR